MRLTAVIFWNLWILCAFILNIINTTAFQSFKLSRIRTWIKQKHTLSSKRLPSLISFKNSTIPQLTHMFHCRVKIFWKFVSLCKCQITICFQNLSICWYFASTYFKVDNNIFVRQKNFQCSIVDIPNVLFSFVVLAAVLKFQNILQCESGIDQTKLIN